MLKLATRTKMRKDVYRKAAHLCDENRNNLNMIILGSQMALEWLELHGKINDYGETMENENWELVANIKDIQEQNPEWTEEQCRKEFERLGMEALMEKLK